MNTDLTLAYGRNDIDDFEQHIASQVNGRAGPDRPDLEAFLRRHPGMTVRDWKGLGPSIPLDPAGWEKPWHRLRDDEVREEAVRAFARELPRNLRQAAARHPDLISNPLAREYRVRQPGDREGGQKSLSTAHPKTGGCRRPNIKHQFLSRARARA